MLPSGNLNLTKNKYVLKYLWLINIFFIVGGCSFFGKEKIKPSSLVPFEETVVLEKAWAKIHGSYERIEAGQAHLTMRDLTGAPAYEYFIEKTPNIFDVILEAD